MAMGVEIGKAKKTLLGNSIEIFEDEILGAGAMGQVKLCKHLETGKKLACKIISKNKLVEEEEWADVVQEIRIGARLSSNPHIVACRAFHEDASNVYMLMELCEGGNLHDYINDRGRLLEEEAKFLFIQIVQAMQFCHSHHIIHRDLKPQNILLKPNIQNSKFMDVKVADFGLSEFIDYKDTFSDIVGTPSYMAPEVLLQCYGPKVDVWSAGVILYEMLSGTQMFPHKCSINELVDDICCHLEEDELVDNICHHLEELNVSEAVKDLIYSMLCRPKQRPTFFEVLQHPWFATFFGASF